jgi:hypothetical protein
VQLIDPQGYLRRGHGVLDEVDLNQNACAQLWRIDWIGGVAYNASVPSEPLIDVCLARLPKGETNPLTKREIAFL